MSVTSRSSPAWLFAIVSRVGKAFALVSDNSVMRVYDYDFNALPPAR